MDSNKYHTVNLLSSKPLYYIEIIKECCRFFISLCFLTFAAFCSPKCDVMYSNPALGCKQCSEGFKEPLCCDCVDGYRKTQSGQCCPENTIEINGICTCEYIAHFNSADERRSRQHTRFPCGYFP